MTARTAERLSAEVADLPKLWPSVDQMMDAEQIGVGAYSPLDGFMDRATLDSVLLASRLPNSLPWTMPILLTPPGLRNRRTIDAIRPGDAAALLDANNDPFALFHLREKYPLERSRIARDVYRTTDARHPNVRDLGAAGDTALAGRIELVPPGDASANRFELTPTETRGIFHHRRWSSVAAFQTRNVPHRAHEHLERLTLDREEIDGLLIHPVVGRPKIGDYRPAVVMAAYETLIQEYLPPDRVVLGSLSIAMRFAGPRAALFLAIVRKNYGCSHYIVGRDQAGVDGIFDPYESQRIFDALPIGVVPLCYPEAFYCHRCDAMVSQRSCPHPESERVRMSQTRVRNAIARGEAPPHELLRPEVAALLAGDESPFVQAFDALGNPVDDDSVETGRSGADDRPGPPDSAEHRSRDPHPTRSPIPHAA